MALPSTDEFALGADLMRAPAPAMPGAEQLDAVDRTLLARFKAAGLAGEFEFPSKEGEWDTSLSPRRLS